MGFSMLSVLGNAMLAMEQARAHTSKVSLLLNTNIIKISIMLKKTYVSLTKVILPPIIPSPMSMTPSWAPCLPRDMAPAYPPTQRMPRISSKMLGTEELHYGTRW